VVLRPVSVLQLSEAERRVMQKLVLHKIQSYELGCAVNIPKGNIHFYSFFIYNFRIFLNNL